MKWIFDTWLNWLDRITLFPGFLGLVIGVGVCVWLFRRRNQRFAPALTPDGQMLKLDYAGLLQTLDKLGVHRKHYAITQVTLDVAFPILYSLLFGWLIALGTGANWGWLAVLPLITACADLIENTTVAWLAWTGSEFEKKKPKLAWVTLLAGKTKMLLFCLSLFVAVLSLLAAALGC
jgi:hypothetical protein